MNFKMGFYKFSTASSGCESVSSIPNSKSGNNFKENKPNNSDKELNSFLKWFVGFSDAEANFLISLDRGFVRFRFKICMHIDNLEALNIIKSKLNIGNVTIEKSRNRCSFVVQDFTEIRDVSRTLVLRCHTLALICYIPGLRCLALICYTPILRCPLFLRSYSINGLLLGSCLVRNINLLRQTNQVRFYSSQNWKKLDPWFLTGFTDGEGSFIISIINNPSRKVGYSIKFFFR